MRVGIFDHFGWAVAVTATADHEVVDRRRLELVEPGFSPAPIHYDRGAHDVEATTRLVADVRASVQRATAASLDQLAADIETPIDSISLRSWPADFPTDIATQMQKPYESRADAIMYRKVLDQLARERGWDVRFFEAKAVLDEVVALLGERADEVLVGPRARLGSPWTKDHRIALAATVVSG